MSNTWEIELPEDTTDSEGIQNNKAMKQYVYILVNPNWGHVNSHDEDGILDKIEMTEDEARSRNGRNWQERVDLRWIKLSKEPVEEKSIPILHIFRITYLPKTNTLPPKIKITSERFEQSVMIFRQDKRFDGLTGIEEIAGLYLKSEGFNVIGYGQGWGCMYVISDTLKQLFERTHNFHSITDKTTTP